MKQLKILNVFYSIVVEKVFPQRHEGNPTKAQREYHKGTKEIPQRHKGKTTKAQRELHKGTKGMV
jgi:hypothetical protein